jgi:hypothetical protein
MKHAVRSKRLLSLSIFMVSFISFLPCAGLMAVSRASTPLTVSPLVGQGRTLPRPVSGRRDFINYKVTGAVGCRDASAEESQVMQRRTDRTLHVISSNRVTRSQLLSAESAGLQIILRGTNQLENFPAAKAAFLNAAARWEALIASPITVVIDVDFGATWFGETFGDNVLGQTSSQVLGDNSIYGEVRSSLSELGASDSRVAIYSRLPQSSVPTDLGATSNVLAPSAVWRVLGFVNSVADPAAEENDLGDPPAVGFNSDFDYDFDPSNGIASTSIDFDAVAVHEIGHVLGFDSNTGYRELVRNSPVAVSVWDIFRFRPGVTADTFTTAQRILSSGGSQTFFDASLEAALSTGRPDGTGGDSQQASHWKDDRLTGAYIGIMDPTLSDGVRETITESDLAVLRIIGFSVVTDETNANAPTINNVSFNGKKLKLKGTGFSGQVELEINGLVVASTGGLTISSTGKKLQIKSSQSELNIQSGSNQLQVISNGVRSNAFTFTF